MENFYNVDFAWDFYTSFANAFIILAKEIASSSRWHLARHSICILLHYLKWNCYRNCKIGHGRNEFTHKNQCFKSYWHIWPENIPNSANKIIFIILVRKPNFICKIRKAKKDFFLKKWNLAIKSQVQIIYSAMIFSPFLLFE